MKLLWERTEDKLKYSWMQYDFSISVSSTKYFSAQVINRKTLKTLYYGKYFQFKYGFKLRNLIAI